MDNKIVAIYDFRKTSHSMILDIIDKCPVILQKSGVDISLILKKPNDGVGDSIDIFLLEGGPYDVAVKSEEAKCSYDESTQTFRYVHSFSNLTREYTLALKYDAAVVQKYRRDDQAHFLEKTLKRL